MKLLFLLALAVPLCGSTVPGQSWVTYEPAAGTSNGKTIVLLSGDEEYRSEEGLPQLGKILSQRHGFKCSVLFSQDANATIDPNNQTNVPGMHLLDSADLVILQFRFRELPDADMEHFVRYLDSGKPMIVLRTATHAFAYTRNKQSPFAKYSWDFTGAGTKGGFGVMTVGETWTYHHGDHGKEGTRGLIDGQHRNHPILKSVNDVFGLTDVYGVNPDFPMDAKVLMWGLVLKGMKPDEPPNTFKAIMPIVWLRDQTASGRPGRFLCSTIGASIDLLSEDLRRLLVNACLDFTDQPVPAKADVSMVGDFRPTMFGFNKFTPDISVASHALK